MQFAESFCVEVKNSDLKFAVNKQKKGQLENGVLMEM